MSEPTETPRPRRLEDLSHRQIRDLSPAEYEELRRDWEERQAERERREQE